ncbi:MAG: hypothetical protein AAGA62_15325, partial [Bacteroidota bacterium]
MAQQPTATTTKALDAQRRGLWCITSNRRLAGPLLLIVLGIGLFSCQSPSEEGLTIAGAANLQYALRALTASFT